MLRVGSRSTVAVVLVTWAVSAAAADMNSEIRARTAALAPSLVDTRRWFHQHPELSNREVETGREIARRLRAIGLEVRENVAHTGVVAVLRGALPGRVVAWRSDIDALPIDEQVEVPYRSVSPGVMHACGHDVHITVGLGAAEVLQGMRDRLHGTVKFIFQPAEEGAPAGEKGGAALMIAEGALTEPVPAAIFGLHVMPTLHVGTIGTRPGGIMAAADRFVVTVHGRMTHGSAPHAGVDAVYVAAQLVSGLQAIAAREIDARRPVVVSVGSLHAGNRFNIVADTAVMEGTVRTLDEATHAKVPELMRTIVAGICQAYGATCDVQYVSATPANVNDPKLTAFATATLSGLLGAAAVTDAEPIMAAEDFAYYGQHVPSCFLFLGVGNPEKGWTSYVHTPTFRPDEDAIPIGVEAAAALLASYGAGR